MWLRTGALTAMAGLVLVPSGLAVALEVPAEPGNDSLATAQDVDGWFSLDPQPEIEGSSWSAHVTVLGDGDGSFDFYSFTVPAAAVGATAWFDIDGGYPGFDSVLTLYDEDGAVLAENDDRVGADTPGSTSPLDAFLVTSFSAPGTHVIRVSRYDNTAGPQGVPPGATYRLHFSVPTHDVVDIVAPVLSLPTSVNRTSATPAGVPATWTATAMDGINGPLPVTCVPASGSTFLPGSTTVECSATDEAGNRATGAFPVNVVLLAQFAGVPGLLEVAATGPSGAVVDYIPPSASHPLFGDMPVSCTPPPGYLFPIGFTTVTCTAYEPALGLPWGTAEFTIGVHYPFTGFFAPVDNDGVLNRGKAGRAVPLGFSLGEDRGLDILAPGSPTSRRIDCDSTAPVDVLEPTALAVNAGLSYDAATDTYLYVWKTDKAWHGTCRELILTLDDGSRHSALFMFS